LEVDVGEKKQIAYHYDSVFKDEDTQVDMDGTLRVPEKGQIIKKHGQPWRVAEVMAQYSTDGSLPVHKVFLVKE
jgi:hypothetical protein